MLKLIENQSSLTKSNFRGLKPNWNQNSPNQTKNLETNQPLVITPLFLELVHKNVGVKGLAQQKLEPQCPSCKWLNRDVNKLATFFKRQTVKEAKEKFCAENSIPNFHLHHTIEVRWTPSLYRSLLNIMANWKSIVQFLKEYILSLHARKDKDLIQMITEMLEEILIDKNFLAILSLGKMS